MPLDELKSAPGIEASDQVVKARSSWHHRMVVWLRQRWCSHTGYLEDMKRLSESQVTCPCNKCGKLLSAFCGLDLPIKWERKPDNDPS